MTRARTLGIDFPGTPGVFDGITDVAGVEVGYVTLVEGDNVRTGVTAILPRGRDGVGDACAAGWHSLNGNGEMTGLAWLAETGSLDLPVLITNTHAVGACHRGVIDWVVAHRPDLAAEWLLPVVAETWDGFLNDINGNHVRASDAVAAIDAAVGGEVAEGSVGGGTGMVCYEFKGGNGTASRLVSYGSDTYTVGAFVQANFGARKELTIAGAPIGRELESSGSYVPPGAGSVIAVIATDAPMLPGQCTALARRVPLGLARTGTTGSHFSGDIFLAFSTANSGALRSTFGDSGYDTLKFVRWGAIDPFYEAVVQAVEEAVINALVSNESMTGRDGHYCPALPHAYLT